MKKQLIIIAAAAAFFVGCNAKTGDTGTSPSETRSSSPGINEPSGANTARTNTLSGSSATTNTNGAPTNNGSTTP